MYISLPGTIQRLELIINTQTKIKNLSAVVSWITIQQNNIHFSTSYNYKKLHCKFSALHASKSANSYYLIGNISRFYHGSYYLPQDWELKSWKNAAHLCSLVGAHLPVFSSRNELNEFIALLKYSNHIPPLEAVYIGLKFKNHRVGSEGFVS